MRFIIQKFIFSLSAYIYNIKGRITSLARVFFLPICGFKKGDSKVNFMLMIFNTNLFSETLISQKVILATGPQFSFFSVMKHKSKL
jgi:hypothetical protein